MCIRVEVPQLSEYGLFVLHPEVSSFGNQAHPYRVRGESGLYYSNPHIRVAPVSISDPSAQPNGSGIRVLLNQSPRTVPKLSPSSRSPPIVLFEDTSQPFLTLDDTVHIGSVARLLNQLVAPPLVIALEVIVLRVFFHGFSKVALAQWNDLGQALGLDGLISK